MSRASCEREHRSIAVGALLRRHELDAARSRRYRQRQKEKRVASGAHIRPPGRLQPGEEIMTFPAHHDYIPPHRAFSTSGTVSTGDGQDGGHFAPERGMVRRMLRTLRARQRHLWITAGRILSETDQPIRPARWRCFCTPVTDDSGGFERRSDPVRDRSQPLGHGDDPKDRPGTGGSDGEDGSEREFPCGLSVLAQVAEKAAERGGDAGSSQGRGGNHVTLFFAPIVSRSAASAGGSVGVAKEERQAREARR